ncbi:hypothetical protein BDK51DRAFT_25611, partial [Blyttiomyces helicus]
PITLDPIIKPEKDEDKEDGVEKEIGVEEEVDEQEEDSAKVIADRNPSSSSSEAEPQPEDSESISRKHWARLTAMRCTRGWGKENGDNGHMSRLNGLPDATAPEAAILNFTEPGYLSQLRKRVALKHNNPSVMSNEEKEAYAKRREKMRQGARRTTTADAKKRCIRFSRLPLDDALSQLADGGDPNKVFEGWSDARVRAYKMIDTKPNSYYYRFNAPGEEQMNGAWTKHERQLFFARLEELGADGQWGIFSMAIPGRVGYQCSNFYRNLLKSGEVVDENYTIDEKGGLHYLFGKKDGKKGVIRTHSKHGSGVATTSRAGGASRAAPKKRKRRSKYGSDSDEDGNLDDLMDEDNSGNFTCKTSWNTTRRTRAKTEEEREAEAEAGAAVNPLPGFTDPITLDPIVKPEISPYGHVMEYDSWVKCLSDPDRKNICPLTKNPLTKRELVVLTHDNIEQYRCVVVLGGIGFFRTGRCSKVGNESQVEVLTAERTPITRDKIVNG